MIARRTCAIVLAFVTCPTGMSGAAERWTETVTAHFTVVSDAGAKRAQATRFLAETKHQLYKDEQALGIAKRAVVLEPAASGHRLTVARILWSLHKNAEALEEANRGLARSRTAQERAEAQELIDFFKAHQG